MNAIDEMYTKYPFFGSRRITGNLREDYGMDINRKRVQGLMRAMGLEAVYPKRKQKTSQGNELHAKYPYLLRNRAISNPNQVWATDITYIRLKEGFLYLTAIMDWFSRYVVNFEVSETLESDFCIRSLKKALGKAVPQIHNSDQGIQYTSRDYISLLENNKIQISMDGRGRCMDNIFVERLWRSVKYEEVYLKSYKTVAEAKSALSSYFSFYNTKRRHQSLNNRTPKEVYCQL